VYLVFYGGTGLLLVGLVMLSAGRVSAYFRQGLEIVGRSSLATYVTQYFVFSTLVPLLALPVGGWWPAYYLSLLGLTFLFSVEWDRLRGNRWLTLGLGGLRSRAPFEAVP
jgi:hypothetical protein